LSVKSLSSVEVLVGDPKFVSCSILAFDYSFGNCGSNKNIEADLSPRFPSSDD
jgi:hypothetical protein